MQHPKLDYNILHVRDYFPSVNNPSSSTWVYDQVICLQQKGYKPLVISPTPINPLKKIFKKKYQLYDVPSNSLEIYRDTHVIRPPYLKFPNNRLVGVTLKNLSNCIFKYGNLPGIKLIHAHFGQNGVAALPLKRNLRVPLITSFYGYDSGRLAEVYKPYYQDLIKEGDIFLALSQDMKNDLLSLGFPEDKIIVHHLGVNLNKFTQSDGVKKDYVLLLTVARLDKVKGIQYVIEALRLLFANNPQFKKCIKYNIVGGGNYERQLKDLVKKYKLEQNIFFINNLIRPNSREIVQEQMQSCDVFLLCSFSPANGGKEGTPVVLMEAQACGKPCIATRHAGIPEIIIENKTGLLVEEKNADAIADDIQKLVAEKDLHNLFSHNARHHIEQEFNQNKQMQRLKQLYDDQIRASNIS
jgi:colanic acid/amylovoran biosynthesis glycosyltransferase